MGQTYSSDDETLVPSKVEGQVATLERKATRYGRLAAFMREVGADASAADYDALEKATLEASAATVGKLSWGEVSDILSANSDLRVMIRVIQDETKLDAIINSDG